MKTMHESMKLKKMVGLGICRAEESCDGGEAAAVVSTSMMEVRGIIITFIISHFQVDWARVTTADG